MKKRPFLLRRFLKSKDGASAPGQLGNSLISLFELIHRTEAITSKLHANLRRDEILDIVERELGRLESIYAVVLLLDNDGNAATIRSITIPARVMNIVDTMIGSPAKKLKIDMSHSTVFRKVLDNKETCSFRTIEWVKEVLPGTLAYIVAGITGHLHKTTVASPFTVKGRVIGILAIDSHEMVDIFLLSVKNLAQHISAALERAEENERRDTLEKELLESREKYRRLVEGLKNEYFFYSHDTDGIFTYISPSISNILGYSPEEFCTHFTEFLTADPVNRLCIKHTEKSIQGIQQPPYEVDIYHKDRSIRRLEVLETPVYDEQRNVVAIEGIAHDITERKRSERALAESEASFRAMFEITSEGVALLDPETGRFVAANPAMCAMFGYSEEEFRLLGPEDITPQETKEIMRRTMATLAGGSNVPDHEGISVRKDGSRINVIVSNRHMIWHGKPVYHITFKDITQLKEIQEQLRKKSLEVIEFTNTVTHDLRKPLTAMKIIFDLAQKGVLGSCNSDGIEAVKTGIEAADYMQEMLEDLTACARLDSGTMELAIEKTNFRELADLVVARLKFQIEEKGITVETPECDVTVNADKKQLTRVLMNLVGNAVNYIGSGVDKRIRIGVEERNGPPVFFVSDNGIGITAVSQPHLFARFKRGENVSGIPGAGLGLYIVKGIVEAHGGRIWFESEAGKGTTFRFTLENDGAAA